MFTTLILNKNLTFNNKSIIILKPFLEINSDFQLILILILKNLILII